MVKVTKTMKERMVDKLLMSVVFSSIARKPGDILKKFLKNKNDKKIIQELKAEDFNHRI